MKDAAALVIVTFNNWEKLSACLKSVYQNTTFPYHIFLIDNDSQDDTLGLYGTDLHNTTIVRNNTNLMWGGGINQGIKLSREYKWVAFMNDDIEVPRKWLENHVAALENPKVGAVGPLNSSQRDWQSYDRARNTFKDLKLPLLNLIDRKDLEGMNTAIQGIGLKHLYVKGMLAFFCTLFRRDTIDLIGELDEDFVLGGDDDDYARRMEKAGLGLCLLLNTYVIHHAGVTIDKRSDKEAIRAANVKRLKEKYPEHYGVTHANNKK